MTKQWTNMGAGRELNAAIAKHVFKWKQLESKAGYDRWETPEGDIHCTYAPHSFSLGLYLWSQTIEYAMMVVEKLEQHPNEILFKLVRKGDRELHWAATFRECLGRQRYFYAQADTAPLAICLAALEANDK